jgi:hypothetical protein
MNAQNKNNHFFFLLLSTGFIGVIFGIHGYLLSHFAADTTFFFSLWQIYAFHLVVTGLIYSIIRYRVSLGKTEIFNVFIVATLLKMIVAILFLLPLILSDFKNKIPDVINFFIPYFLFLTFEVFSVIQIIQKK